MIVDKPLVVRDDVLVSTVVDVDGTVAQPTALELQQQILCPENVAAHVDVDPLDTITQAPPLIDGGCVKFLKLVLLQTTAAELINKLFTAWKRARLLTELSEPT